MLQGVIDQEELLKKLVEGEVLSEDLDIEEMLDRTELGDLREQDQNIQQKMNNCSIKLLMKPEGVIIYTQINFIVMKSA